MSQKKFLDKIGLQNFLNRIKALIPTKTSELQNDSGFITSEGTYDSALSLESEKAVQNKVVTAAINGKQDTLSTAQTNAVDSGITSAKVQGYDSHISDTDIHVTQADKTSWDSKAPGTHTHLASEVSGLSTVATSGSYNDLSNKPSIPSKTSDLTNDSGFLTSHNPIDSSLSSTSTNAVQNKVINNALSGKSDTGHTHLASEVSGLSTVATSGSYSDLTNKPTIDSALSSTSTNAVQNKVLNTELGKKANTTDLATVATSGSYADLSNKPTIPTVNNATLTIQKNGTTVKTFTANSSTNVTADITVPTKVSELTNDSGFLTSHNPVDSALSTTSENAVQNKVIKAELDNKANSADLSTVATTGSYFDLNNIPSNFTPASHTHGSITNDGKLGTASRALITDGNKKIAVSSVTSTELGYLSGVTSAVQDQLDGKAASTHSHTASEVSGLATVATSGSYNDLTNKPTIPTVNNATLTIQKNGTTVKTFTANASSNVTANITVPTKVSELTNDSGFLTSHNPVDSALSDTSTNAVQNKVVKAELDGKSDTGHTHTKSEITDFPTLATVATSGSYNDLSNKPTIPTVNNKTLTIQKNGTNVATFTANSSSNVTANITVPTNVSELTNDSGYLTASSNLDSSKLTGTIDIARLPKGALERLVTVANQTARFALTSSVVQLGDTVKQLDTGVMYIVSDESKLSSNDGYTEYTAGSATSVPWSGVSGKPSSFTPSSHTHGSITNDGKLGTASRALVTDSSKKIAVSSVTSTELGYLSGVTSAIQTQLNGKAASSHTHTTSEVTDLLNSQHTWTAIQTYQPTNFYHSAVSPCNILKDTELEEGVAPATAHAAYPGAWYDKNSNLLGYSRFVEYDSGVTAFEVDIRNKAKNGALDPTGTQLRGGFQLVINPDETSHLRIYANTLPNVTNAYNLGDSTHQWNNLYAKNYFYNGTAWGLDKANVWTGHNYFPLSLSQKGFSPRATTPATAEFGVLSIEDTNSLPVLSINYANRDSGTRDISLRIYDTSGNSDGVGYLRSSSFNAFQPLSGNIDLGSSSNKWKNAYANNVTTSSVCLQGDRNAYIVPMWAGAGSGISLLTQDATKSVYVGSRTTDENNRSVLDSTKGHVKITAGETGGNNVACIEPIATLSTLGTTSHYWGQVFGGEYHAYNGNAFMAKNGGYTFLIRNDSSNTYFLMSEQNGGEGTYSNARPLIINNATGVCNINGNCGGSSNGLATSSSFVQNGLTFSGGMFAIGDTAGKAYKGSSNNAALISFPENGTYWNDTTVNIQNLRFTWASDGKYFQDIFLSPNNDYIWHRNVGNSVAKGWRRIVEENVSGLTNQTWDISIAGNAATASSVAWTNVSGRPTNISSFTNDSGYLTSHQSLSNYSTLANTVKSLSISGKTITVTPGSGSAYTLTTQDTVYTHPTTAGNKHIPSGGSTNQYLKYSSSGTAVWATINSSELNNDQNYSRGLNTHAINFDWSETYSNKVGIKVDNTWLGGILTTANTTIPTKTSDLTNDSGFLTSHQSLSNYVTLNGNQIITGQKTFQSGGTTIKVKATNHERGVKPSTDSHNIIQFCDKSGYQIGYITRYKNTSGNSCVQINSSDYYKNEAMASDGTEVGATLTIGTSSKGNPYWQAPMGSWENIYPHSERNNSLSIGTFTNRWNQVFANEYHAYNGNGFMLTTGDYTSLIRNDGGSTYFLVSEQNGDEGTWSTARPLQIVNSTGICNINGNAATANEAKKVKTSITAGTVGTLVDATMGSNDCFRIAAGGDTNAGWVELATGDDYSEPIYVRQYQGTYTTLKRSATLLDANGNTDFPGTVTATFSGNLTGNVTGNVTGDVTGNCSGYSRGLAATNVFGNDRLTYTEGGIPLGSDAGKLFKGSSNNAALVSAPENGTYFSDNAGNVQNLRFTWAADGKYLHDIFVSPNNNYIWHRDVVNGTAKPWRRVVEENATGLTNQTWSINVGGNAATATQFSANKSVTLTGDVTGTASSKAGWSVTTTLANSGVTAGTYGPSADVTGNNNATISVPQITVDAKGRVTSVTNRTLTCKNNTYTVNNATLTIQKNGTNVQTFTANQSSDATANITVPTKVSELTNDSGFLTSHQSLSNYVTLNSAQTISGNKTFTGTLTGTLTGNCSGTSGGLLTNTTFANRSFTYTEGSVAIGTTAGKAFKGSSNNAALVSFPENGTSSNNTSANIQNLRLTWQSDGKYLHDLFTSPNSRYFWHRDVNNASARPWRRIVEENTTDVTPPTWDISISGSSGSCTGNAATATTATESLKVSRQIGEGYVDILQTYQSDNNNYRSCTIRCTNGNGHNSILLGVHNESNGAPSGISVTSTNGTLSTSAPTPATADNSTQIATTAFVKAQGYLTSHQSLANYLTKTANVSEMGRYIDLHYDNATSKYDYDVRLYVDSQGTAAGGGSFKISAATAYAPAPASDANDTRIATTKWVKDKGYLTSHQDLSLYPYKLVEPVDSFKHWPFIDLGDTTTYPNGFNDLMDIGKFDVRAVIGTTPNTPSISAFTYIQGILEVEWLRATDNTSLYRRIIQRFHRVGATSVYDIYIRRAYLNSSSVWVWADWEQVVTIEDIPKIVFAYASRSAITDAGNGNYKRASASSLYYCYFVNGSFTVTSTKVGSSGTYELQSGGVSQTPGTDKICGLWFKIA